MKEYKILIFIIIIFFLIFILSKKVKNDNSVNQKLKHYLGYQLVEKNVKDAIFEDDKLYLLDYQDNKTNIYKYRLNENKKDNYLINDLGCQFLQSYIYCDKEVYNLELVKLDNSNNGFIVPYKNTFLIYKNNNLYLKQNTNVNIFRILTNASLVSFYYTDSNTFILFKELNNYVLYDINLNAKAIIKLDNYNSYSKGFLFYNEKKLIVYNLEKKEVNEYQNLTSEDLSINVLAEDSKTLYIYDNNLQDLVIWNLEKQDVNRLKLSIKNVEKIIVNTRNNVLGLLNNNLYLIDLNYVNSKLNNLVLDEEKEIKNKVKQIKDNYNVNIKLNSEEKILFPDFYADIVRTDKVIEVINKIEKILAKFNLKFFNEFYSYNYKGLNIYLTGALTPKDYNIQIANPAAYSLVFNKEYMIVIDVNQHNMEKLVCHELMHNLEFQLINKELAPFNKWQEYNPKDFTYNNSYTKNFNFNYTLEENDKENIYFIDEYSHTYSLEDRARIFENICFCEENSIINDYSNLYLKGIYLKEEIIKYYPSLKDAKVFRSLN